MRIQVGQIIVATSLILSPAALHSQRNVAVTEARTDAAGAELMARPITIRLDGVTLKRAVGIIAASAGAQVMYKVDAVNNIALRVTLHATKMPLGVALGRVLAGTGLRAVPFPGGFVNIEALVGARDTWQGSITGTVTEAHTHRPIAAATVSLDGDSHGIISDEEGRFRFAGVTVGPHTVQAKRVGYTRQVQSVSLEEGASVAVYFRLEPSTNVLDQVVVTGTIIPTELKAVPNAITVITAKQIEERGITRIDQLFRGDVPGLFSINMGSSTTFDEVMMFSRGATALVDEGHGGSAGTSFGTNPIKTYVDGVEMANPQYLSQIDPKSIERIEILTGPQASTIYGSNAINGVMQIFTKRGVSAKPQLTVAATSGVIQNNFSSALAPNHLVNANASGVEGRLSYNMNGSWQYDGSWTPGKQTQRLDFSGAGKIDLNTFAVDLSARQGVTRNRKQGDVMQGLSNLRATGVWVYNTVSGSPLPQPQTGTLTGRTLGLSLKYRPVTWWSHELIVGSDADATEFIKSLPGYRIPSDTSLLVNSSTTSRTSERYSTTAQVPLSSAAGMTLTLGGDHWRTDGSSWSAFPLTLTGSLSGASVTRDHPGKNSGIFVQGQLGLYDALFFTYGVRSDWNPTFGSKASVVPGRYGVAFTHDVGTISAKLHGSYGRAIRPPLDGLQQGLRETDPSLTDQFGAYYSLLPNPYLEPEDQRGGEGGLDLYFGSRASLIVTRYNQTVDNLISIIGASGFGSPILDSVRSLAPVPDPLSFSVCSSPYRDAAGYCYHYQAQYLNVGSIRNQGWELQGSLNTGPFTTRGTYSWTKSRVLGITPKYRAFLTGSELEPGRPFDYAPEHTWALGITYAHTGNTLALNVNGLGLRYVTAGSDDLAFATNSIGVRLRSNLVRVGVPSSFRPLAAGYTTADFNAMHQFSSRLEATMQVNNLTNYYQNDFGVQYAAAGRQSRVGLRWRVN